MKLQAEFLSRNIELSQQLGKHALASFEEQVSLSLAQTHELTTRASELLKAACAEEAPGRDPLQWTAAWGNGVRRSLEWTRDAVGTALHYQGVSWRLWHEQTVETRKLVAAGFGEPFAVVESAGTRKRRAGKSTPVLEKLAA